MFVVSVSLCPQVPILTQSSRLDFGSGQSLSQPDLLRRVVVQFKDGDRRNSYAVLYIVLISVKAEGGGRDANMIDR